MAKKTFPIVLESSVQIAPKVLHLRFTREDGLEFPFVAGQFIMIHFEYEGKALNRSYSLANKPSDANIIEFAASYVEGGAASELLFNLKPGDKIDCSGPFGRLILRDEEVKRYVLIATGTGVTPYLSMLEDFEARFNKTSLEVAVIYGTQKPETLIYGNNFVEFSDKHPAFNYTVCYSRECPDEFKKHEMKGHVQDSFETLDLNPDNDIIYLCGNPNMIDDAFALLQEKGFTTAHVRREKYVSPKRN